MLAFVAGYFGSAFALLWRIKTRGNHFGLETWIVTRSQATIRIRLAVAQLMLRTNRPIDEIPSSRSVRWIYAARFDMLSITKRSHCRLSAVLLVVGVGAFVGMPRCFASAIESVRQSVSEQN